VQPRGRVDLPRDQRYDAVAMTAGRRLTREFRVAGAKVHPVAAGRARLTLGTASGSVFVPSGVVLVDADKVGAPLAADNPAVGTVPASELPLGTDTSTLWALFFWLEVLAVLVAGAVWTWRRRGHAQAWISSPPRCCSSGSSPPTRSPGCCPTCCESDARRSDAPAP
jgi:hypothetical protein